MPKKEHNPVVPPDLGPGFVLLDDLAVKVRAGGRDAHRKKHDHAYLMLLHLPPKSNDWLDLKTSEASIPDLVRPGQMRSGLIAFPLVKTDRNVFDSKITVGRARNNDMVIRSPKISKLHCAFLLDGLGHYRLSDLGSLNGTVVNGAKLKKKEQRVLQNGDLISFWRYVFEFVGPDGMLDKLEELLEVEPPAP